VTGLIEQETPHRAHHFYLSELRQVLRADRVNLKNPFESFHNDSNFGGLVQLSSLHQAMASRSTDRHSPRILDSFGHLRI
jgi:hypothetical protein